MSNGESPEIPSDRHQKAAPESPELPLSKPLTLAVALPICVAGLVVPGLGHVLLKRWVRGVVLAGCVLLMFFFGLGMSGKLYTPSEIEQPLQIFAFFADVGVGLPYWYSEQSGLGIGEMTERTFDYGTTFLWVAGLLNYLIVLDAFDIARGRKP